MDAGMYECVIVLNINDNLSHHIYLYKSAHNLFIQFLYSTTITFQKNNNYSKVFSLGV